MNALCIARFGKSRVRGHLLHDNTHTVIIELPLHHRKKGKKYVKRHKRKHNVSIITYGAYRCLNY